MVFTPLSLRMALLKRVLTSVNDASTCNCWLRTSRHVRETSAIEPRLSTCPPCTQT
jgi:hypothetical protein